MLEKQHPDSFIQQQYFEYKQKAQLQIQTLSRINQHLQSAIDDTNQTSNRQIQQIIQKTTQQYNQFRTAYQNQFRIQQQKLKLCQNKQMVLKQQVNILKIQLRSKEQIIRIQNQKYEQILSRCSNNSSMNAVEKQQQGIKCSKITQMIEQLQNYKHKNKKYEQQLSKIKEQLAQSIKRNQQYQNNNIVIKQQIQYLQTQTQYYKQQYQCLKQDNKNLRNKIDATNLSIESAIQQENSKWWKINENLLTRIKSLQNQSIQLQQKCMRMYKDNEKMQQNLQKQKSNSKSYLVEIGWYKQLLKQAKGQFVCNQLSKQNIANKLQQQKIQLIKQNRKLKEEIASLKSKQNVSYCGFTSQKVNKNKKFYQNKVKSPLKVYHQNSTISVADFDKQVPKTTTRTPDKFGSMPSTTKTTANHHYKKQKNKQTPKK